MQASGWIQQHEKLEPWPRVRASAFGDLSAKWSPERLSLSGIEFCDMRHMVRVAVKDVTIGWKIARFPRCEMRMKLLGCEREVLWTHEGGYEKQMCFGEPICVVR